MSERELEEKLARATKAFRQSDFSTAIELLSELAVGNADNSDVWYQLGLCYLETRHPDLALEALGRAVKAAPDHATAHYALGNAYGTLGQLERASACYRRALEIEPHHAKAEEFLIKTESLLESREHYRRGLQLLYSAEPSAGDLNAALRELTQSVAIFENSPARDNLLDCARKLWALKTDWEPQIELTSELESWAAACERGYHCLSVRNWEGVIDAYQDALNYRVQDAFVHHALGFGFAETGAINNAVRAWLRTVELDPRYDFSRFGRVKYRSKSAP